MQRTVPPSDLGTVFLKTKRIFGRVYFADLSGAGLCSLAFLLAMYLFSPENLIVAPLILWSAASVFLVRGAGEPPRAGSALRGRDRFDRVSFWLAGASRYSEARRV